MTWRWTRAAGTLTSTCQLCHATITGRRDNDVTLAQRSHSWQECAQRRAEARAVEPEPDVDYCPNGHNLDGNTSTDKSRPGSCLACRREDYAAKRSVPESGGMCCGSVELGVAQGRMMVQSETVQSVNSEPPLSTPSTNRKEAVDS